MPLERHLNVQYQSLVAEINMAGISRLGTLKHAIKAELAITLAEVVAARLLLYRNDQLIDSWAVVNTLPPEYFTEGGSCVVIDTLASPVITSVDSPLIGQVFSVSINQLKVIKAYLTPAGSAPTTPVEGSPSHFDFSQLGLMLEPLFYRSTTARPCVVIDVQPRSLEDVPESPPNITILLITGFGGKPLNQVMSDKDFTRVVPISPTIGFPGTSTNPIKTIPKWMPHPSRKVPSYVLCIPIKVYANQLRRYDEVVRLEAESLERLKVHVLFLGGVVANAGFVDLDDEDDEDDDGLEVSYVDFNQPLCWDEVVV